VIRSTVEDAKPGSLPASSFPLTEPGFEMARGLFVSIFTEAELLQIRDKAKAALISGTTILNYTDSGTSVGKSFTLPVDQVLDEVRFALRILNPEDYGGKQRRILIADLRNKDFD
jgi:hypothetical protein